MAGKHDGVASISAVLNFYHPADKFMVRSYAEGRDHASQGGLIGGDPHPATTPASDAWLLGFSLAGNAANQKETAIIAVP